MSNWKFSYAGVDLPPPDEIAFAVNPIDDAERNANGDMFIQPVAVKRTLNVSWSLQRGDKTQAIFNALRENREGVLVFFNIETGAVDEMRAYYGAGASASFMRYDDDLNKQQWASIRVNFIEM